MTKNKNSVQGLIGFERFSRFGVKTDKAEIAFFSVEPTNISVLSAANIDVKIHHLMMLLSTIPDLEILALDSCECFDTNKVYVKSVCRPSRTKMCENFCRRTMIFLTRSRWRCPRQDSLCLRYGSGVKRTSRYSARLIVLTKQSQNMALRLVECPNLR